MEGVFKILLLRRSREFGRSSEQRRLSSNMHPSSNKFKTKMMIIIRTKTILLEGNSLLKNNLSPLMIRILMRRMRTKTLDLNFKIDWM